MFSYDVLQLLGSQLIAITLNRYGLLNDLCRHGGLTNGLSPGRLPTSHHDGTGDDCPTILGFCHAKHHRSATNQASMQQHFLHIGDDDGDDDDKDDNGTYKVPNSYRQ